MKAPKLLPEAPLGRGEVWLYRYARPTRVQLGTVGRDERPIFADCGGCEEKEAVMVGRLAKGPRPEHIVALPVDGGPFFRLAHLCASCVEDCEAGRRGDLFEPA